MTKIDNISFHELDSEKYWSFPKSYKGDVKEDTRNMIFSGEYMGAVKKDGAYYRFIKDMNGEMSLQGRNRSVSGTFLNKIGHVPHLHDFFAALPNGSCLLGELYFPEREGSNQVTTIMGCKQEKAIARQEKEKLCYYVFDAWAYNGKSLLETAAEDRFALIQTIAATDYVEIAQYHEGKELWDVLQSTLNSGGEGIVMTKKKSSPQPGKRTARKTLKVKKELADTIDVVIMGANPPTKEYKGKQLVDWEFWITDSGELLKGRLYRDYAAGTPISPVTKAFYKGWAGSLIIGAYDAAAAKVVPIGSLSGLTELVLCDWQSYVGKVAEITCMEIFQETRGLRHPKFLRWREDKTPQECNIDRIFE